jgi:hypothetical protein
MRLYRTQYQYRTTILACHIPKAMGSWLRKELVHGLGPEMNFKPIATFVGIREYDDPVWDSLLKDGFDKFSLIEGHFVFDWRAVLCSEKCFTVCTVRNPVEMFWSLVKYIEKTRGGIEKVTLATQQELYLFDNPMCRYFSGFNPPRLITKDEFNDLIIASKKNIENNFDFIFVDKYLDACCKYFHSISGIYISPSEKINASNSHSWILNFDIFRSVVTKKYGRFIDYDLILYDHILELFINCAEEHFKGLLGGLSMRE